MMNFKLFFQLVKSKWHSFLIYIGIFLVVFALMLMFNQPASKTYQAYSCEIAVIDHDQSEAAECFKSYLAKENTLTEYQSQEEIEDALFLRMVSFGIVIEPGFLQDASKISLIYDPGMSSGSIQGQRMVEEYLQLMNSCHQLSPDLSNRELHAQVLSMLDTKDQVQMLGDSQMLGELSVSADYFNILGYALMGLMINVIGECIVMMFGRMVYIRQQCAPQKPRRVVFFVFASSLILGVLIILSMCGIIVLFQKDLLSYQNGWFYLSNAFCFGFAITAISCLVGMIASGHETLDMDKNMVTMFSNVIALTFSFISGLFVPQYLIHPVILKFASLTPAYWYAKTNNLLAQTDVLGTIQINEILQAQGIILLFGVVFLVLAYLLYRDKRQRQAF